MALGLSYIINLNIGKAKNTCVGGAIIGVVLVLCTEKTEKNQKRQQIKQLCRFSQTKRFLSNHVWECKECDGVTECLK